VSVREPTGRFAPGASGNAAGRPRGFAGLAAAIRAETNDGRELVQFALRVLRDESIDLRLRIAALGWLADRGWGKALVSIEVDTPGAIDPLAMTSLEREQEIERLLEKRATARAAAQPSHTELPASAKTRPTPHQASGRGNGNTDG
jgi:hypothetical protein